MSIKIGDKILVGKTPTIDPRAVGAVFEVTQINYLNYVKGKIILSPNGWTSSGIMHEYKAEFDTVLSESHGNAFLADKILGAE